MEVTFEEMLDLLNGGVFVNRGGWRQKVEDLTRWLGSKSNYLSKKLLDLPLSATAFTAPATVYVGLWASALDDTSSSSTAGEVAYTSYARVAVTNNATNFPAATGSTTATKTNANAITWPASTGGSATVTYLGIFDVASGGGNLLYWCSTLSAVISNGDTPQVSATILAFVED